jgi:hypothetical protein
MNVIEYASDLSVGQKVILTKLARKTRIATGKVIRKTRWWALVKFKEDEVWFKSSYFGTWVEPVDNEKYQGTVLNKA